MTGKMVRWVLEGVVCMWWVVLMCLIVDASATRPAVQFKRNKASSIISNYFYKTLAAEQISSSCSSQTRAHKLEQ